MSPGLPGLLAEWVDAEKERQRYEEVYKKSESKVHDLKRRLGSHFSGNLPPEAFYLVDNNLIRIQHVAGKLSLDLVPFQGAVSRPPAALGDLNRTYGVPGHGSG